MIYKFYDQVTQENTIEYVEMDSFKVLEIFSKSQDATISIELNEKDLFNLIGALLKIQSHFKNNGKIIFKEIS